MLALASLVVILSGIGFNQAKPATAAALTDSTVNFQARLENNLGAVVPDGTYNIEFKLYSASTGGSALWTEDYLNSASNGVQTVDGYLSVGLGSITPFPSTINWSQPLYLTMNIGGTSSGTPTWDGEMNPRLQLTAIPYAFQAGSATQLSTTNGSNTSTLSLTAPTGNDSIALPDASGTVCLDSSASCGFASSSGSSSYIQNGTSLQGNANFNIQSSSATSVTASVKALTGQTANLLQFDNSSGTAISGINASGQLYYQSGSYTGTLVQNSLAENVTYYLPDPGATSATICISTGNCTGTGGGITGTGTANYVAKFSAAGAITSSSIYDNGSFVGINSTTNNGQLSVVSAVASESSLYVAGAASSTASTEVIQSGSSQTGDLLDINGVNGSVDFQSSGSNVNFTRNGTNYITATGSSSTLDLGAGGTSSAYEGELSLSSTGAATFMNEANSAAAFQIQNAAGSATLTSATAAGISSPSAPTITASTTGGTLTAGAYYFALSALANGGSTLATASSPTSVTTTGTTSSININWTAVTGATGYDLYYSNNGTTWSELQANLTSTTTSYADIGGAISMTASLPTVNTTVGTLNVNGVYQIGGNTVLQVSGVTNTFLGVNGGNLSVTGIGNFAVGDGAEQALTTGSGNTAEGYNTLQDVTTGSYNIAENYEALQLLTTGSYNIALGNLAEGKVTTASYNVGIGTQALQYDQTGNNNIAIGQSSLYDDTSSNNTSIGVQALEQNTTGIANTAIGHNAGYNTSVTADSNTTGSYNTFIGNNANIATPLQIQDATSVGVNAAINQSNALSLGCTNAINSCTATTSVGIGTAGFAPNLLSVGDQTYGTYGTSGTATTIIQSATAITGSGTTFTSAMNNGTIYYSDGTTATVTYVSATSLTSSVSKTVAAGSTYTIVYGGFNVTANGTAYLQPITNSTTAFQVQNSSNTPVLDVDASNGRVGIGTNAPSNTLDIEENVNGGNFIVNHNSNSGSSASSSILLQPDSGLGAFIEENSSTNTSSYGGASSLNLINSNSANLTLGTTNAIQATISSIGATTFKNSTNSTAAFQIQNAAGTSLLKVDTTNSITNINSTNSIIGSSSATITSGSTLTVQSSTSSDILDLKNTSGSTLLAVNQYALVYGTANGTSYFDNFAGHVNFAVTDATNAVNYLGFNNSISGSAPTITSSGNDTNIGLNLTTQGTGGVTVKPGSNSTTAFQVQNAAGSTVLDTDTTNKAIGIDGASTTAGYALNVTGGVNTSSQYSIGGNTVLQVNGTNNTGVGVGALINSSSGAQNTALGASSLQANTTGSYNNAFGASSLQANTTGSDNDGLGYASLGDNTTGSDNNAIGIDSLTSNTTGYNNNAIGSAALYNNSTGHDNDALGYSSLEYNTTGSTNNALGSYSLNDNTTGYDNDGLGTYSLINNTTGDDNDALGYSSLQGNISGSYNNALGSYSLNDNTTGYDNDGLSTNALLTNTTGTDNNALGYSSLEYNTTGSTNNAVGTDSLEYNTTNANNNAFGSFALQHSTGYDNSAFGDQTLQNNTTGYQNNAFGRLSLVGNTTGNLNVALGFDSGVTATTADENTTGSNNTYLGSYSGPGTATQLQNSTAIGTDSVVSANNALILGCINGVDGCTASTSVGIGTSTPSASLNVVGTTSLQGTGVTQTINGSSDTVQSTINSSTAFQVQNAAGVPVFLVDTTDSLTNNVLTNGGFEIGAGTTATGWSAVGGATISRNTAAPNHYGGLASELVTTSAVGAGLTTTSINGTPAAGTYTLSFYAQASSGTVSGASFKVFLNAGTAVTCTGATLVTTGFQRVTCASVTAPATITSATIEAVSATAQAVYIDGVQVVSGTSVLPSATGEIQLRGAISNPVVFQALSNSTSAFQVVSTSGLINELTVDTLDNYVQIGSSTANTNGVLLRLNNYSNGATEPTEVDGAIYYNSAKGSFRCGQAGAWTNCIGGLISANTAASTALTGSTTGAQSFSTTSSIPANYCVLGRVINVTASGILTTTTTAQPISFSLKLGTVQVGGASVALTPSVSLTSRGWRMEFQLICDAAPGATSAVTGEGWTNLPGTTSTAADQTSDIPFVATNVATNAAQTLTINTTFTGTASASNTVTLEQLIVNGE